MVVVKGWNTQRCLRISGVARRGLAKSGLGGHAATYAKKCAVSASREQDDFGSLAAR